MSGSVPMSTHLLYSPFRTIYVHTPSESVFTCVDHCSHVFSLSTSVLCELDDNTLDMGWSLSICTYGYELVFVHEICSR